MELRTKKFEDCSHDHKVKKRMMTNEGYREYFFCYSCQANLIEEDGKYTQI